MTRSRAALSAAAVAVAVAVTGAVLAAPGGGTAPASATAAVADPTAPLEELPDPTGDELHVMTFNLRFAADSSPNSWADRRPVVAQLLRSERPHVIGTQEGLYQQLRDIEADQRGRYESIGLGRDGGSRGEAMQVFYDHQRLQPLEYDHFWLSDTPDVVGSQTWAGCCPRMVTWVRFLDLATDEELYVVNTHLEAFDAGTRGLSAELLRELLAGELDTAFDPELPVVMTADFNEPLVPGGAVHDVLLGQAGLVDTWATAERRGTAWGSFPNYRPPVEGGPRIDAVLTSPDVTASATVLNDFSRRGQYPSDHLPVQVLLDLPGGS